MDHGYAPSYGAQGGANGGGFMSGSQGDSGNAKRTYGKDTLRPVTIKQLLNAFHPQVDAEHFIIDDNQATQITFVGQVRNISAQHTNITYKLDDGTGIIEVKVWVDADAMNDPDSASNQKPKPVEQGYARVWGRLKEYNGKRHVGANVIRPITDFNEISYHLLEATAVHLQFTRGAPDAQQGNGHANGQAGMNGMDGGDNNSALSTVSGAAKKIYQVLKNSPHTNEGLHTQDLANRTGLQMIDAMRACEELASAGLVYPTVDDSTFALLSV